MLLALLAAIPPGALAASSDTNDEPEVRFPVVFFPPVPPVYGVRILEHAGGTRIRFGGRQLTPPDGLADFAGELLYPALSTRLYSGALSQALATRLEAYRARRNKLVHALLDQNVMLHDAADDVREREFRAIALVQTSAIAALEIEAETLQRELTRNRLGLDIGWNTGRKWKLDSFPARREWMNLEAEFQIVRAAAFYQEGLVPAQRGLLRELALELEGRARKARGEPAERWENDAMFFSPETARLRLPPDLSRAVLDRIGEYNAQKAALKAQLRQTVNQQEKSSRGDRVVMFSRLAEEQWPRLAQLETLAEELRGDLAPRFIPAPPEKPPAIPSWLIDVIQSYNEDRDSYFGELQQAMRTAAAGIPRPPRSGDSDEQIRLEDEYAAIRKQAERDAVLEFQQRQEARFAALAGRYAAIRTALEAIAKTTHDPKTGRKLDVETLLRQHTAAMAEFDGFGRATAIYTNYRIAMLQRGLSPEQRRLLFSYAVAGLAQPLPYGEPLPRAGAKFPIPR